MGCNDVDLLVYSFAGTGRYRYCLATRAYAGRAHRGAIGSKRPWTVRNSLSHAAIAQANQAISTTATVRANLFLPVIVPVSYFVDTRDYRCPPAALVILGAGCKQYVIVAGVFHYHARYSAQI